MGDKNLPWFELPPAAGYEIKSSVRVERALPLWCDRLNLIGKANLVEFKHEAKRQKLHDDPQLAAQAMCLEDMLGRQAPKGAIFHASSHQTRHARTFPTQRLGAD